MAGTSYTRQSTITDGNLITASLFNNEYNQLLNAFVYSSTGTTGHTHDGTAGQGGAIGKIGDQDFNNKIEISTTNNRIECYIEVGGSSVEQLRIQDGAIVPVTDSDIDLGTTSLRFKDAFVDSLTVTGVVTATGFTIGSAVITEAELEILDGKTFLDEDNLSSDSATGIPSQQSVKAYVDAQVTAQDLDLTDGTTSISIDLDSEALSVLGGTGITSTASGNGVTLAIDSTVATLTGTQTLTNKTLTTPDVNTPDIDGGTIDGAIIGGTTAAAGSFTTVDATGNITVGGTVDGRDVAADGTKLDGIETAATSDQTDAEIRAAVEAATDSNVFTDADHSKLNAIEASADVTDTANVTAAGALMDSEVTNLAEVKAFDSSDYATAAQGTLADNALPKSGGTMTGALVLNNTGSVKVSAGTTGQREGSPAAGMFRYNTTEGKFEGYSTEWGEIGGGAIDLLVNTFTGNGSTTAYTMSSSPLIANTLVYIDGVYQNKSAYSIANDVITFSAAPASGAVIEATAATVGEVSTASTSFAITQLTGNGSTTAFTLSAQTVENNTNVYFDGVYQSKANYTVSGSTITFSTAPANGVAIEVMGSEGITLTIGTPDNGTVTTAKIVDDAVTSDKLAHSLDVVTDLSVGGASNGVEISNGAIALKNSGTQSKIDFYCETSNAHYTRLQAAPHSSYSGNIVLTLPASDGDAGQFLQSNGSGVMSWAAAGGLYNDWLIKTANYTMVSGDQIIVNKTTALTMTLPASPSAGDVVTVKATGGGTVTIGRNSSNINSTAADGTLNNGFSTQLVYVDGTIGWLQL